MIEAERVTTLALIRELEVIGEAATQMSAEGRASVPELPWPQIISMRNRLIHGYADVNFDTVWMTATERLPELIAALEKYEGRERP